MQQISSITVAPRAVWRLPKAWATCMKRARRSPATSPLNTSQSQSYRDGLTRRRCGFRSETELPLNANGELMLVKSRCHALAPSPWCRSKIGFERAGQSSVRWSWSRRVSCPAALRCRVVSPIFSARSLTRAQPNANLNRRSGHHHGIRSWCDAVHRSTHRPVLRMRLALTTTTTGTPDGNRRTPRISSQTISTHCCTFAKRSRSASSMAGAGGTAGNRRPIRQVGGPPRALLRKR